MRERYATWGHLPVYLEPLSDEFMGDFTIGSHTTPPQIADDGTTIFYPITIETKPEYLRMPEWHDRQLREGVDEGIRRHPGGPPIIPASGLFLVAERRRGSYVSTAPGYEAEEVSVISELSLYEAWSGMNFGKKGRPVYQDWITRAADTRGLETLGGDYNPFPDLFGQLASYLPTAWPRWAQERRLKRWTPVPEWLVAIKAQRRKRG
jgi:hypothetical protein